MQGIKFKGNCTTNYICDTFHLVKFQKFNQGWGALSFLSCTSLLTVPRDRGLNPRGRNIFSTIYDRFQATHQFNSYLYNCITVNCEKIYLVYQTADSIFNSKIRYGLQLMGKVRSQSEDGGKQKDSKVIQLMQNKMVRLLNNVKISDKQSTISLFKNVNMLSVNQINAQIKLKEIWKAVNIVECPLKIVKMKDVLPERPLRSKNENESKLLEAGFSELSKKTFMSDRVRLWNKCPSDIVD